MPIDYKKYPADWKTRIRPEILERAEHCCEICGVPNYALIIRSRKNPSRYVNCTHMGELIDAKRKYEELTPEAHRKFNGPIKVVLTISHLNHETEDNRPENLKAMCQRCHLLYDVKHHSETRKKNKNEAGKE